MARARRIRSLTPESHDVDYAGMLWPRLTDEIDSFEAWDGLLALSKKYLWRDRHRELWAEAVRIRNAREKAVNRNMGKVGIRGARNAERTSSSHRTKHQQPAPAQMEPPRKRARKADGDSLDVSRDDEQHMEGAQGGTTSTPGAMAPDSESSLSLPIPPTSRTKSTLRITTLNGSLGRGTRAARRAPQPATRRADLSTPRIEIPTPSTDMNHLTLPSGTTGEDHSTLRPSNSQPNTDLVSSTQCSDESASLTRQESSVCLQSYSIARLTIRLA